MIRRLYNSCPFIDLDSKLMIIEAYIQKLVNSGHKFPFIKAVILQGITKHKAMVDRSNLKLENKKYLPLYRPRNYKTEERLMMKYVDAMVWYTDVKLGDPYKGEWKGRLLRRKRIDGHLGRVKDQSKNNSVITTAMFVPPSREGRLLKLVEEVEKDINSDLSWRPKILEQSGTPLLLCFGAKFPLADGCPRGHECLYCENDGIRCAARGVVYEASCKTCKEMLKVEGLDEVERVNRLNSLKNGVYVGETSRPIRERIWEHKQNLVNWRKESFQLSHWMMDHTMETTAPVFEFRIVSAYSDPLRRQICEGIRILEAGTLNRRCEFNSNEICRMVADKNMRERELDVNKEVGERRRFEEKFCGFANVMSNLMK